MGIVYVHGGLRCVMPSSTTLRRVEERATVTRLLALGGGFLRASFVPTPETPPQWIGLHSFLSFLQREGSSSSGGESSSASAQSSEGSNAVTGGVLAQLRVWSQRLRGYASPAALDDDAVPTVADLEHGRGRSSGGDGGGDGGGGGAKSEGSSGAVRKAAAAAAMARLNAAKQKAVAAKGRGKRGQLPTSGGGKSRGALGVLEAMKAKSEVTVGKRRVSERLDAAAKLSGVGKEEESLLAGFQPNIPQSAAAAGAVSGAHASEEVDLELQRALELSLSER